MLNLYPFLAYVFVTTFTPGPNNIMSMSNAMRHGYRRTLGFMLGIFVGFVVLMLVCALLNVALISLIPQAKPWISALGAIYMVYLALHIMLPQLSSKRETQRELNTFWAGFVMQFLNPKVILYGVTVFSTFIVQSYSHPLALVLFSVLLAMVGFVAVSSWALGGDVLRNVLEKHSRPFNLAMGALLLYTAIASLI